MISPALVVGISFGYLLLLFGVAYWADWRAAAGRSVVDNAWMYALSMAVYCTAWTYFGSIGRAASGGVWYLPIYFGPTLAMLLGWMVLRKMNRIAKAYRITSIADFIGSRYGKSPLLAGLVTLIAVVGIVPYIALQLKAVSAGYAVLTSSDMKGVMPSVHWTQDTAFYVAMVLAGFTMVFGARRLGGTERHEGMVAAIAFESIIKLVAFLAVGGFVVWGLFDGLGDVFARAAAEPATQKLLTIDQSGSGVWAQWFALTLLSMLSVLMLPRQFQIMVVENVREAHLRRALWVFPLYMLLINLFVLPIALGGLLYFGSGSMNPENFILSLPLSGGQHTLAVLAFIGGLSAATGMVIVETIAVSTMVSNEVVLPLILRWRRQQLAAAGDVTRMLLGIRRAAILGVLVLGYVYYHLAGEAYALVSIGLISFAAVAQFAPALLGGIFWKGGTKLGALVGLSAGFAMWVYTLMMPSIAKSGWLSADFLQLGLWGQAWLRPEQFLGLIGMDPLTHSLFWSLLVNVGGYVLVSLWRAPSGAEASQALLFVDVFERSSQASPVFWRGRAKVSDLAQLCVRFLGRSKADSLLHAYALERGLASAQALTPDARLVQYVEMQLAGAVGSASARVLVASVAQEESLTPEDVLSILDEASQLRSYSRELEDKSQSLQQATDELRRANEQLKSLDLLKDDFMSSVTHELRTPLTSIRALAELLRDDPDMDTPQRQQFIGIIVAETERLSRLVNQVLDMAKIESGHAEWVITPVDVASLIRRAVVTTAELFHEKQIAVDLQLAPDLPSLPADDDRLMQVMMNLLTNAAKFVPVPGGQVRVTLAADAAGLTVCVQDNGPGVPPEQQSLIFDKFRQGGAADHRPQGTGLGLPISRDIVAHFGGRLWLESTPSQGACFAFFLPWINPVAEPAASKS